MKRSLLPPVLSILLLSLFSACSDDGPDSVTNLHYYTAAWSIDSKIVAFGVEESVRPIGAPAPETNVMELVFVDTDEHRRITLPSVNTRHAKYAFEVSNKVLAVLSGGVRFFDLEGKPLWHYDANAEGFVPADFELLTSGNGFIWGATRNGRTHVAITRYDRATWSETEEEVLLDSTLQASLLAVALTSHRSYALRLTDGMILEFDFNGQLLNSFESTPFTTDNFNHQRLFYFKPASGNRTIYAMENAALMTIDLDGKSVTRIITGGIRDFSVHPGGNFMVYETYSSDTWFALSNGYPLTRILPHNVMPRFSPDGKYLTAIGVVDPATDSLSILAPNISS